MMVNFDGNLINASDVHGTSDPAIATTTTATEILLWR